MARNKMVNGEVIPLTVEEETVRDAEEAQAAVEKAAHDADHTWKRRAEYPPIGDQLDMLWHAIDGNDTLKTRYTDFHTAIKTIKDANPK
jgi:hypothetical protein